jgi:hypothetical protein
MPTSSIRNGHWLFYFNEGWTGHSDLSIPGNFLTALPVKVLLVEVLREQRDVVEVQTSSGTFFANGLATHNCYARETI